MTDTLLREHENTTAPLTDIPTSESSIPEAPASTMRESHQLDSKGEVQDRADALALHKIYEGLLFLRKGAPGDAQKIARLAVQHLWQQPNMPYPRHTHNKPLDYPWSEKARELYFAGNTTGNLVLEHMRPISNLVEALFSIVEEGGEHSEEKFYQELITEHANLCFTVIAKEDDDLLTKAGLRKALVAGDDWARYSKVGLMRSQFSAVTEDERFKPDLIKGRRGRFADPKKSATKK